MENKHKKLLKSITLGAFTLTSSLLCVSAIAATTERKIRQVKKTKNIDAIIGLLTGKGKELTNILIKRGHKELLERLNQTSRPFSTSFKKEEMQEIAKKMTAKEIEDKLKEIGYAIDGIKNESENKWINGNIWVQQLKQKIEEAKAYLNNLEADKYEDFADELRNQITVSENYKDLSDADLKALRSDLSKKLSEIKAKAENRKREWIQAQEKLAKLKEKAFDLQKTLNDRFHFALLRQFNILNNSLVENELTYLNIKSKLKEFEDKLKQIELDSNIRLAEFEALKKQADVKKSEANYLLSQMELYGQKSLQIKLKSELKQFLATINSTENEEIKKGIENFSQKLIELGTLSEDHNQKRKEYQKQLEKQLKRADELKQKLDERKHNTLKQKLEQQIEDIKEFDSDDNDMFSSKISSFKDKILDISNKSDSMVSLFNDIFADIEKAKKDAQSLLSDLETRKHYDLKSELNIALKRLPDKSTEEAKTKTEESIKEYRNKLDAFLIKSGEIETSSALKLNNKELLINEYNSLQAKLEELRNLLRQRKHEDMIHSLDLKVENNTDINLLNNEQISNLNKKIKEALIEYKGKSDDRLAKFESLKAETRLELNRANDLKQKLEERHHEQLKEQLQSAIELMNGYENLSYGVLESCLKSFKDSITKIRTNSDNLLNLEAELKQVQKNVKNYIENDLNDPKLENLKLSLSSILQNSELILKSGNVSTYATEIEKLRSKLVEYIEKKREKLFIIQKLENKVNEVNQLIENIKQLEGSLTFIQELKSIISDAFSSINTSASETLEKRINLLNTKQSDVTLKFIIPLIKLKKQIIERMKHHNNYNLYKDLVKKLEDRFAEIEKDKIQYLFTIDKWIQEEILQKMIVWKKETNVGDYESDSGDSNYVYKDVYSISRQKSLILKESILDLNKSYKDDNGNLVNPTCFSQKAFYQTEFSEIIFNKNVQSYYIHATSKTNNDLYELQTFSEMPNLKNIKYTGKIHTFNRDVTNSFTHEGHPADITYSRLVFKNCHNLTEIYLPKVAIVYLPYSPIWYWSRFPKEYGASAQNLWVDNCEKLERITIAFLLAYNYNYRVGVKYSFLHLNNLPKLTAFYSSIIGEIPDSWSKNVWYNIEQKNGIDIDNNINCSLYLSKWSNFNSETILQKWTEKAYFGFKAIYKNW